MLPQLYYITQPIEGLTYPTQVELVCRGGVKLVQLRLKEMQKGNILSIARNVKQITDKYGAYLIINDNPEIAAEAGAYGVHLGLQDIHPKEARKIIGKGRIIGGTANTFERVLELHEYVDYFGIGPFRFTQTKKNLAPVLGFEGYRSILQNMQKYAIQKPVYAIGGIEESDFNPLMQTGIHGIAVSSVISKSNNITFTSQKLNGIFNE